MRRVLMCVGLMAACVNAMAAPIPELVRYLEREIGVLDAAVAAGAVDSQRGGFTALSTGGGPESSVGEPTLAAAAEGWYLRNFWLRIRTPVGFEIPGIAKVTIVPEGELLWQRAFPEGWAAYKP